MKKKQINFQMPEDVHCQLAIAAEEEDLTVSQLLRLLVKRYFFSREVAKDMKKKSQGKK